MFDHLDDVDNGWYTRYLDRRRDRSMNFISYSGPSDYQLSLMANGERTVSTHKSSVGTIYGGIKRTVDQNNIGLLKINEIYKKQGVNLRWNTGGPFISESLQITAPTYVERTWGPAGTGGGQEVVVGHIHPDAVYESWMNQIVNGTLGTTSGNTSDRELLGLGATAIARTIPTKPEMSLSTALGELRGGIPHMIGSALSKGPSAANAADEFLNYSFGIAPTFRDASDILSLTKRYEEILKQFKRDNGRMVRRRLSLADTTTPVSSTSLGASYGYTGGGVYPISSSLYAASRQQEKSFSERIWFSGAYQLAYPLDLDNALTDIIEFNRVFGVIPSPELAWNLLPWSWLVDWFTNVGDVITNVSSLGSGTRLSYGYVMCESSYTNTISGSFGPEYYWLKNADSMRVTLSSSLIHTRKRRLKASPFGFSVGFSELSNFQKAILAALGLSRLRL